MGEPSSVSRQFDQIVAGLELDSYRDPIELAAEDYRIHEMVHSMHDGDTARIKDTACYLQLLGQVGESYELSEREVLAAIEICEDRRALEMMKQQKGTG